MRRLTAGLIAALAAACVASFVAAPARGWWLPANASVFGARIDALFELVLVIVAVALVLVLGLLAFTVLRGGAAGRARPQHGDARLELVWTLVPGAVLVWIAFAQSDEWAELRYTARKPDVPVHARVVASQFDWHFVYPGSDARFGTLDDLDAPYELVVPVGSDVVLELVSRDVIHSFAVPALRVKQDIVPGMRPAIWFRATRTGSFDVVCSELCGFGHYKMAGRLRVVSAEELAREFAVLADARRSNGHVAPGDERR